MLENRVNIIKSKLAANGITQMDIARELQVTQNAIQYWVKGLMTSKKIEEYFKKRFGEGFISKLKNVS